MSPMPEARQKLPPALTQVQLTEVQAAGKMSISEPLESLGPALLAMIDI